MRNIILSCPACLQTQTRLGGGVGVLICCEDTKRYQGSQGPSFKGKHWGYCSLEEMSRGSSQDRGF